MAHENYLEWHDEDRKRKRFTLLQKDTDEPIRRLQDAKFDIFDEPILKVEYFEEQDNVLKRKNTRGRPKKQIETLEWSDEATETLIELWKTKGELFSKQHPHFYVRDMKDKAVEYIKDELSKRGYNVTSNQILSKFQSLRTYFCSQRTKMSASKKNGYDDAECKWRFFKGLQFLDDNMKPRETNTIKRESQVSSPTSPYSRSMVVNEDVSASNEYQNGCQPYFDHMKEERRVKTERESEEAKLLAECRNEDQLFGELVGNMIHQLPSGQNKDILKLEIQQMIIKTKYSTNNNKLDD